MSKKGKLKVFKILIAIVALLIIIGIIAYLFPVIKNISTSDGQEAFKEKVQNTGILGMFSLFGLQMAQIFLIIIPGEPIEILAGMCYGAIGGTIFILVTAFIISTSIFMLVRKFGKKFVYSFYVMQISHNNIGKEPS